MNKYILFFEDLIKIAQVNIKICIILYNFTCHLFVEFVVNRLYKTNYTLLSQETTQVSDFICNWILVFLFTVTQWLL